MSPNPILLEFKHEERAIGDKLHETVKPKPPSPVRSSRGAIWALKRRFSEGARKPQYLSKYRYVRGKEELGCRGSLFLYANNPEARVRFARVFLETVRSHLQSPTDEELLQCPVYLVTFALKRFCCSVEEAESYDLRPLQAWVRQVMEGQSYLGMVEAAFYSNIHAKTGPSPIPKKDAARKVKRSERDRGQTVSWHVHLLVWGVPRATLKAVVDEVNAKHESLVRGLSAADYRQIRPEHFDSKVLYILKSPREYRVWQQKEEVSDPDTGEVTVRPKGRYTQKSRHLRRGDAVRMLRVMRDRYLDWMMLGGGTGRDLLLSIREKALQPLRRLERRCRSVRAS